MTSFQYPLDVIAKNRSPVSAVAARADVVVRTTVNYTDFNAGLPASSTNNVNSLSLYVIPAGWTPIESWVDVITVWASADGNTLNLGTTTSISYFAKGLALDTGGRKTPTLDAAQVSAVNVALSADTTLVATVSVTTSTGARTAGQAIIYVRFA